MMTSDEKARWLLSARRRFARKNGAPKAEAEAFAKASDKKPTMNEFVEFVMAYLSR